VKKFFLGALFSGQELHVIQQQNIDRSVLELKFGYLVVPYGVDEFVHERFRTQVHDLERRPDLLGLIADCVHEVGFSEADSAIDEQGVVGSRRLVRHGQRSGVGELIGGPYHEGIERVSAMVLFHTFPAISVHGDASKAIPMSDRYRTGGVEI